MKANHLALLFVFAASIATAADQAPVSGHWQIHAVVAGNELQRNCTFTQKDAALTGTCDTAQGTAADVNGKVEGEKVSFSYKSEYSGTPITLNYEGKLEGGKISGTLSVPEFSVQGDFTATPAK